MLATKGYNSIMLWRHCRGIKTLSKSGHVQELDFKPVIDLPVKVQNRALKRQEKIRRKKFQSDYFEGNRKIPVIQCRRPELNHYFQQTYSKYKKLALASEHWQSYKTNGDYFTFKPFLKPGHRNEDTPKSFADLNVTLDTQLIENLKMMSFNRPTLIQEKAIPEVMSGESKLIASETGNGKTLAFLIPAIQQVLNNQLEDNVKNSPQIVIATPGRELATQIYDVASSLCYNLPVDVKLEGGYKTRRRGKCPMDILIGSFGTLNDMFGKNRYSAQQVHHLIFDEADSLLDDTFNVDTISFLKKLAKGSPQNYQVTLVGATYPTSLTGILEKFGPSEEIDRIATPRLHSVLPHVTQKFIRVQAKGKENLLLDILLEDIEKKRPTLIFSNKVSTAGFVSIFLKKNGINTVSFHSGVVSRYREEMLEEFTKGRCHIMSCTDLASRGIDTSNVKHVINYDFPLNMSDYIHRIGRVGRVASPNGCKVTNFVRGGIQAHLVQKLEEAVRTQCEIPAVNSNIIRIIRHKANLKHQRILQTDMREQEEEDY